jgi:putative salt-induced outer membrane protein YdiY
VSADFRGVSLRLRFFAILLLLLALPAARAAADEVILHNGDRVTGVVTGITDGKIIIAQTKFGTISASLSDVKSVAPASATQPAAKSQATTAPATQASTQPATQPATKPTTQASTQPATQPASQPATQPAAVTTKPVTPPPAAAPVPKPPPVKRWSGAVTATALATRGNSESESIRVSIDALRKGDKNTLTLAAAYALGQTEDATGANTTNIDNWFASAKLDYAFNEKWYNYALVRVEEDNVANLALRVSPGIGVGYRWINKPDRHFNTEMGVSYVWERFDNDGTNEHVALRLAYHYDRKLNDKVSLVHNLEYLPSVEDLGDFNLNADLGLRAQLTENMFGEFKVEWRHDASPAPGADENDLRYTIGVGWKF